MLWGLALGGRRYSASDYACAAAVTTGCALFVLTGDIAAPQLAGRAAAAAGGGAPWLAYGMAFLAAFLVFDGLASTSQDRLFSSYEEMHSWNQLLYVSAWSAGLSAGLLGLTGQLGAAAAFVLRQPSCMGWILLLSGVSTAVQLFIFLTIQQYGALHFALMMTVRQFLSIVLSCLVFSHQLSPAQW